MLYLATGVVAILLLAVLSAFLWQIYYLARQALRITLIGLLSAGLGGAAWLVTAELASRGHSNPAIQSGSAIIAFLVVTAATFLWQWRKRSNDFAELNWDESVSSLPVQPDVVMEQHGPLSVHLPRRPNSRSVWRRFRTESRADRFLQDCLDYMSSAAPWTQKHVRDHRRKIERFLRGSGGTLDVKLVTERSRLLVTWPEEAAAVFEYAQHMLPLMRDHEFVKLNRSLEGILLRGNELLDCELRERAARAEGRIEYLRQGGIEGA